MAPRGSSPLRYLGSHRDDAHGRVGDPYHPFGITLEALLPPDILETPLPPGILEALLPAGIGLDGPLPGIGRERPRP